MKLNTATFLIVLLSLLGGCATVGEIDRIKHHEGDVEVGVATDSDGRKTLRWQSQPGYTGELLKDHQPCRYFMPKSPSLFGAWIKTKEIEPIDDRFVSLYSPLPSDRATLVSEFVERAADGSCRYLVYGESHCSGGNSFCTGSFTIQVLNGAGVSVESFALPKRSDVPLRKWPWLGVAAIIDVPAVVGTAALAVIAVPSVAIDYLLEPN